MRAPQRTALIAHPLRGANGGIRTHGLRFTRPPHWPGYATLAFRSPEESRFTLERCGAGSVLSDSLGMDVHPLSMQA